MHVRCGVICASSHTRSSAGDPVKAESWTKVSDLLGVHGSTSTSCRGAKKKSSSLLLFLFQLEFKVVPTMLGRCVLSLTRHFLEARAIRHHKPLQLPSPASSTGFDDVASRGFARAGPPVEVAAVNLRSSRVVTLTFDKHFHLWLCGPCLLGISIITCYLQDGCPDERTQQYLENKQ